MFSEGRKRVHWEEIGQWLSGAFLKYKFFTNSRKKLFQIAEIIYVPNTFIYLCNYRGKFRTLLDIYDGVFL